MKKILFLTNMYPSKKNPTYGIFVEKTYKWLQKIYNVDLIKIYKHNFFVKIIAYFMFYTKAILKGVLQDYDCIYAHYISHCALPVIIIRLFKKNIIIIGNIHGEDVFSEYIKYKKNKKRACLFLKYCNYIISPSNFYKNKLNKEYGFPKEQIFVSPSGGVNTDWFIPKDVNICKEKIGLKISKKHIGMVSRLEEGKGWDVFIKAVSMITSENVEFVIVGSGSCDKKVRELINELGIENKMILFPEISHDKLPDVYGSFDIFCFPSRRLSESLGLVGLEAMSCEKACIISSIPGPSTYCNDDNCLRFDPDDEYQLYNKIIQFLNMDNKMLTEMKTKSRETALKFDCKIVEKVFLDFFCKII